MSNHDDVLDNCNCILIIPSSYFLVPIEFLEILHSSVPICHISIITSYISYLFSKNGEIVQSYANQVGCIIDEHLSEANKQTAKKVVKKVKYIFYEYRT